MQTKRFPCAYIKQTSIETCYCVVDYAVLKNALQWKTNKKKQKLLFFLIHYTLWLWDMIYSSFETYS